MTNTIMFSDNRLLTLVFLEFFGGFYSSDDALVLLMI